MRITWVARDSVDRDGALTDSLKAHCHHHSWTSPHPLPQPACLGGDGPPRSVGQGSGPLLESGRSLWSPERYYCQVEELESGVP